jgi:hypothetical protein
MPIDEHDYDVLNDNQLKDNPLKDEQMFYNDAVIWGRIIVKPKSKLDHYDLTPIATPNQDGPHTYTYNVKVIGVWPDKNIAGPFSLTELKKNYAILRLKNTTGGKKTRRRKSKRRLQRKMRSRKSRL